MVPCDAEVEEVVHVDRIHGRSAVCARLARGSGFPHVTVISRVVHHPILVQFGICYAGLFLPAALSGIKYGETIFRRYCLNRWLGRN